MQRYTTIALAVTVALVVILSCHRATQQAQVPVKSLPQKSGSLPDPANLPNNNELCLVCHMDFAYDPITEDHISKNITCAHCHGNSIEHEHDETMMTSPDILYGRREVESLCKNCHGPHKDPQKVEAFRQEWLGNKRENGRSITSDSICTDCHGLHTIARR